MRVIIMNKVFIIFFVCISLLFTSCHIEQPRDPNEPEINIPIIPPEKEEENNEEYEAWEYPFKEAINDPTETIANKFESIVKIDELLYFIRALPKGEEFFTTDLQCQRRRYLSNSIIRRYLATSRYQSYVSRIR